MRIDMSKYRIEYKEKNIISPIDHQLTTQLSENMKTTPEKKKSLKKT